MSALKAFFEEIFMSVLVDSGLPASVTALQSQAAATVAALVALKAQVADLQAKVAAGGNVDPADLAALKASVDQVTNDLHNASA